MTRRPLFLILAVILLAFPSHRMAAAEPDDLEKLQGVWKVEELDGGSVKKSSEELKEIRVIIAKDIFHLVEDFKTNRGRSFEFTLDPSRSPKWIDMRKVPKNPEEFLSPSIYKLDGDSLTVAFVVAIEREGNEGILRPTEFKPVHAKDAKPPYGIMLFKLTRTKEAIPQAYIDVASKPRTRTPISIPKK